MRTTTSTMILLLLALAAGPAPASPAELYRITDTTPGFDESTARIAGVAAEAEIDLDASAIAKSPAALDFVLPDGRRRTATKTRFAVERSYLSWSGEVAGSDGSFGYVHLVDHGDRVSGVLNLGAERYQIVATSYGSHRLVRVEADVPTCLLGSDAPGPSGETLTGFSRPETGRPEAESLPGAGAAAAGAAAVAKSPTILDLLAIYPDDFTSSEEAAMLAFVETSVSLANDIFANSTVPAYYRLLETVKLTGPQPPATGLFDVLEWMDTDPQELLDLREEYAADIVAMFVPLSYDADEACGAANLPHGDGQIRPLEPGGQSPGLFETRAFSTHRSGCGLNDYTFAHEVGHNFGMRHRTEDDNPGSNHRHQHGRGRLLSFTPWEDNANGTLETTSETGVQYGYQFTPIVGGWVVGLGGRFGGGKAVRLWDNATGELITTKFIVSNNAWEYVEVLPPIQLDASTTYTVAVYIDQAGGGSKYANVAPFPRTYGHAAGHADYRIEGSTRLSTGNPNTRPTQLFFDVMYGQVDVDLAPHDPVSSSVMSCDPGRDPDGDITGAVCARVPHFSDPGITHLGLVTGEATRNNAAVARAEVDDYAGFVTNDSPTCSADNLTTPMNTDLPIEWEDLLANDTDPNGDTLYVIDYGLTTAQGGSNDTGHPWGFYYTPPADFIGTDWFAYTVSDRPPGHPAARTDNCAVYVEVTGVEELFGEWGSVEKLTHSPKTVLLSRTYTNPVVITQTLSQNAAAATQSQNDDTAVVRVTDVQSDRFTLFVHEAPDCDGSHASDVVSYLVVEEGEWQLLNGSVLRAGRLATSSTVGKSVVNQWTTVAYGTSFSSPPVVLSQVQTNNDPSWVKTRHTNVGTTSFRLGLEKEEASAVSHGTETVGWIAVETGSGTVAGHAYVAGHTANVVTDAWYTLAFGGSVDAPLFFAAIATYDGADNAALRYSVLTATSVQVRVEEDTTLDAETAHTSEVVDFLVLSADPMWNGIP